MSYAESLLADGERITYRAKQHWLAPAITGRYAVGLLILAAVLFVFGIQLPTSGIGGGVRWLLGWVMWASLVVGLLWLLWVYLRWSAEDYIVTDRRVLKVEGIMNKHTADSSLDKINDAIVDQNVFGRMLGFGDLEILTAAEESVDRYKMIARVLTFKRAMLNAKHDIEEGIRRPATPPLRATAPASATAQGATTATAATAATTAAPERHMTPDEVTQTLARLADLRDRGAITPDEYEIKKGELLDRI